ncbi:MAG: hypothetical protein HZB50_06655 [Chloroflexi bacterium]|nr:hypothetical protein [Chloroflexota bacterium]
MENKKTQSQIVSVNRPWIILPKFQSGILSSKTALKDLQTGLLLWIVFLLFLGLVQFSSPDLPDNDGYYHIKLAYLMRTEGIKPEFPWLPLSILNPRDYSDHHFLFHIALIPFTFGDLRIGAKMAAILFASLAFLSTWYLLKNQRISYAPLWALGLVAVSEAFIYRMSITRAQSLSLAVLMLGLDWLLRKKYKRLAVLGFVYVWMYDAFPLLGVFAMIVFAARWVIERKPDLRLLLYPGIGIVIGLFINPYFPHNIIFAVQHILPKLMETTTVRVGNEWYPYDTATLLTNSPLALAAFVSAGLALGLSGKRADPPTIISFLIASFLGLMLLQSRRYIEYFAPFALVFAAFAWSPVMASQSASDRNRLQKWLPVLILSLVFISGGWVTFRDAQESLRKAKPYQTFAGASAWLATNTPAGTRVFQTDWDDFPRLFFYNSKNTYLIGLDATYMQLYDDELYKLWVKITQGDVEQPGAIIASQFGAHYILTDLSHEDFLDQAAKDPRLVETYRDEDAVVFLVVEK